MKLQVRNDNSVLRFDDSFDLKREGRCTAMPHGRIPLLEEGTIVVLSNRQLQLPYPQNCRTSFPLTSSFFTQLFENSFWGHHFNTLNTEDSRYGTSYLLIAHSHHCYALRRSSISSSQSYRLSFRTMSYELRRIWCHYGQHEHLFVS